MNIETINKEELLFYITKETIQNEAVMIECYYWKNRGGGKHENKEYVITMTGKIIVIELGENDCCDSYATDMAIEKVQYLINKGLTSGNSPPWYIEDVKIDDYR